MGIVELRVMYSFILSSSSPLHIRSLFSSSPQYMHEYPPLSYPRVYEFELPKARKPVFQADPRLSKSAQRGCLGSARILGMG